MCQRIILYLKWLSYVGSLGIKIRTRGWVCSLLSFINQENGIRSGNVDPEPFLPPLYLFDHLHMERWMYQKKAYENYFTFDMWKFYLNFYNDSRLIPSTFFQKSSL